MYIQKDYLDFIKEGHYYDCIIIDPPWKFDNKLRFLENHQLQYNLWDDNIKCLKYIFNNIKCKYLFIWCCNSLINEVIESSKDTSFIYKTMVTWVKLTSNDKLFYGLGNTFRNATEQLLVFQKEKCKSLNLPLRNVIMEKCGKRTIKPKQFEKDLIDLLNDKGYNTCYIFSGNQIDSLNCDCIDIMEKL